MKQIKDQIVWITGASSGIGEALAYALSERGCKLILSSRRAAALERVRKGCKTPEQVHIVPLDLEKFESLSYTVTEALGLYGSIDILINNAGISQRSLILETKMEVYKKLMDVNYLGTIALSKALLPHFVEKKQGYFVTVTSLMGKFGSPLRSGYCGAKHALHGFFDVMRMEHEQDGIACTLICPGFVQTNIARNAFTADGSAQDRTDTATEKGLPPARFAQKMIRAMERRKFEAYIGRGEVKGVYLKRFFPKLLHQVVLRSQVV